MTNPLKVLLPLLALLASGCSHGDAPNPPPPERQHLSKEQLYIRAQEAYQNQIRETRAYERTTHMPLDAWNR